MTHSHAVKPIPRGVLIGAAVLIAMAMALAGTARLTDIGTTRLAPTEQVKIRELRFVDQQDGSITVTEATTGRMVAVVPPGTNGFLRASLGAYRA